MTETLYQHGTLALLVPGLLKGTITMKELLEHGDTGIGTGEGLDGELIILKGKPYQVDSRGNINEVSPDFVMPFADIHQANYKALTTYQNIKQTDLYADLAKKISAANVFYSTLIHGTFKSMHTRAVAKSKEPYPTLAATADAQSLFNAENVTGTLLSYFSPELFHGAAVAGFHSHFLADDHSIGGHVLDFELTDGKVSYQIFDTLEQHFPVDNQAFMQHDFSKDDIAKDINHSE